MEPRARSISVAGRNDSYGDGLTQYFIEAWEAKGGEVTADSPVLYDPEAATYDAEAGQITSEDADGYVIVDFPETFVKVGPALVRTGQVGPEDVVRHRRSDLWRSGRRSEERGLHRGPARHGAGHAHDR